MAIYHLTAKTGSAVNGQSGLAKSNYIKREGKYLNRKNDDVVLLKEDLFMPAWAKTGADFWKAADKNERANARIFKELEFALPIELSLDQQTELIVDFIHDTFENDHPMTVAIHAGKNTNPHCHLMFSERINDGMDRTPKSFFKRANRKEPSKGGALKADCSKKWWLKKTREVWANCVNQALEKIQSPERVSHLSLQAQGIGRTPQLHRGVKTHNAMKANRVTARTEKVIERETLISLEHDISLLEQEKLELEALAQSRLPRRAFPSFPDLPSSGYGVKAMKFLMKVVYEVYEMGECECSSLELALYSLKHFDWESVSGRDTDTFKEILESSKDYLEHHSPEMTELISGIERVIPSPDQGYTPSMRMF